jgi:hypothetical protein
MATLLRLAGPPINGFDAEDMLVNCGFWEISWLIHKEIYRFQMAG